MNTKHYLKMNETVNTSRHKLTLTCVVTVVTVKHLNIMYSMPSLFHRFSCGGNEKERSCLGLDPMHVAAKLTHFPRLFFRE
jgi:hypothetical protein